MLSQAEEKAVRKWLIAKIASSLAGHYYSEGRYLSGDYVLRAVESLGLGQDDDVQVRQRLRRLGVEIDDPEGPLDLEPLEETDARADGPTRRYLLEIGSIQLLQPQDEITLARRFQAGKRAAQAIEMKSHEEAASAELRQCVIEGRQAEHQMVAANLRLVVAVAKLFATRSSFDLLDLIQEGVLGLFQAVDNFDPQMGIKFSTGATWWVRRHIARVIADTGRLVRLPAHINESIGGIAKIRRALTREQCGKEPSPEEIAEKFGSAPPKVQFLIEVAMEPLSLDSPVGEEKQFLARFMRSGAEKSPEGILLALEQPSLIGRVLSRLTPRERSVLTRRFGLDGEEPETLDHIGRTLDLTRERVRQIEAKAINKLRNLSRTRLLKGLCSAATAEVRPAADNGTVRRNKIRKNE